MSYYGFEHRYGENIRDEDGDLIGCLYIFNKKAKRDNWINNGDEYRNQRGYRDTISYRYAARLKRVGVEVKNMNQM